MTTTEQGLRAYIRQLEDALGDCWGEAYLARIPDEGPTTEEALDLIMSYAREALGGCVETVHTRRSHPRRDS